MEPSRPSSYLFATLAAIFLAGLSALLPGVSHRELFLWSLTGARLLSLLVLLAACSVRRRSLTAWIFWSMLAGLEVGIDAPQFALHLRIFSDIFLRLIQMTVAPLLLGVLTTAIGKHSGASQIGRLALKSLIYFEVLTTLALLIGLCAVNISRAGVGLGGASSFTNPAVPIHNPPQIIWERFLIEAIPENLAKSVAENHVLQVAVFAIFFGLALGRLDEERKRLFLTLAESFIAVIFQLTNLIMYVAPFAVGGALAYTVAHSGFSVMLGLGKLILTLYAAIAEFVVLGMLPAALLARVPVRRFVAAVSEPAAIAFSTSTSEAALPVAMERMEELGVPATVVGFVIPTGYSFNLAGSCLYLSLAAVFMAQAGGLHLSFGTQLMMVGTMMLTSKGIAGIPRAVFIVLAATAASFHLPLAILPALLGVDALMDMGRATVNVVDNCLASAVVARWDDAANNMDHR